MRATLIFPVILAFSLNIAEAQQTQTDQKRLCDSTKVYMVVEKPAAYKAGNNRLLNLVNNEISLPERTKGATLLKCFVDCQGEASRFVIFRTDSDKAAKALVELLEEKQGFTNATQNGNPVNSYAIMRFEYNRGKFTAVKTP